MLDLDWRFNLYNSLKLLGIPSTDAILSTLLFIAYAMRSFSFFYSSGSYDWYFISSESGCSSAISSIASCIVFSSISACIYSGSFRPYSSKAFNSSYCLAWARNYFSSSSSPKKLSQHQLNNFLILFRHLRSVISLYFPLRP